MATTTDQHGPTTAPPRPAEQGEHGPRRPGAPASGRVGKLLLGLILVLGVVALIAYGGPRIASSFTGSGGSSASGALTHTVSRGRLRITVTEDGNVESASNIEVKCRIKGGSTILAIVQDGRQVEGPVNARIAGEVASIEELDDGGLVIKVRGSDGQIAEHEAHFENPTFGSNTTTAVVEVGDPVQEGDPLAGERIVELDPSTIEDELTQQRITVENARASYLQAKEQYEAAQIAVEEYEEGTYVQNMQDLEAQVEIAKQNLNSAQDILEHTRTMFRKGFATELQLQADQASVRRAELELQAAETAKKVLQKFTKRKMMKELVSTRDQAKAQMSAAQATLDLEESKLKELRQQLDHCVLIAPQPGMVVYANEERRRSQDVQIEEGAQVRDRQTMIRLPDLSRMQVEVTVHESKVGMVRPGMPATVMIRDREMSGIVRSISNRPESVSWFQADIKQYPTIVEIEDRVTDLDLKPGMSAQVEILVDELSDVLSVPVQSVVELNGGFYAWVATPTGPQKRRVVIGSTNDKHIEIKDGVKEGEQVVLNPRSIVREAREGGVVGDEEDESTPANMQPPGRGAGRGPEGPRGSGGGPQAGPRSEDGEQRGGSRDDGRGPGSGRRGSGEASGGEGFLSRLDQDGDGKISKEEAPGRMKQNFETIDSNSDGFIGSGELTKLRQQFRQRRQQQQQQDGQE